MEEAESTYLFTLENLRATVPPQNADLLRNTNNAARFYLTAGKLTEAEQLARTVVEMRGKTLGREHPWTLISSLVLAEVLSRQGKHGEAEALAAFVVERRAGKAGRSDGNTLAAMESLALIHLRQGKYVEAEALSREALATRQKAGYKGWRLYLAQAFLGASLAGQRKFAEAEPLLMEGCRGVDSMRAKISLTDYIQMEVPRASLATLKR
jgi:tetratricopeptide (TPR) repeat protein